MVQTLSHNHKQISKLSKQLARLIWNWQKVKQAFEQFIRFSFRNWDPHRRKSVATGYSAMDLRPLIKSIQSMRLPNRFFDNFLCAWMGTKRSFGNQLNTERIKYGIKFPPTEAQFFLDLSIYLEDKEHLTTAATVKLHTKSAIWIKRAFIQP